jgi:hypothetical protein
MLYPRQLQLQLRDSHEWRSVKRFMGEQSPQRWERAFRSVLGAPIARKGKKPYLQAISAIRAESLQRSQENATMLFNGPPFGAVTYYEHVLWTREIGDCPEWRFLKRHLTLATRVFSPEMRFRTLPAALRKHHS